MAVSTHVDRKAKLRKHTVSGSLTLPVLQGILRDVYAHPDYDPTLNVLWDLRDAVVEFSSEDVRQLTDAVGSYWQGARAAIVATNEFAFGMARMYEMVMSEKSSGDVMVFRSLAEAEQWLGVDESPTEQR